MTDKIFQAGVIFTLDRLLGSVADDGRRWRIPPGRQESPLQVRAAGGRGTVHRAPKCQARGCLSYPGPPQHLAQRCRCQAPATATTATSEVSTVASAFSDPISSSQGRARHTAGSGHTQGQVVSRLCLFRARLIWLDSDSPSRASHLESHRPILPPRPAKSGECNFLSVSPNSTGSISPVNSRPTTPNTHHRPPPLPPVSRSRPSSELDIQPKLYVPYLSAAAFGLLLVVFRLYPQTQSTPSRLLNPLCPLALLNLPSFLSCLC